MTPTADDLAARLAKLPHMPEDAQRWVVDAISALRALEAKQGEDAMDARDARQVFVSKLKDEAFYGDYKISLRKHWSGIGFHDESVNSRWDDFRSGWVAAIQQSGEKK